MYLDETQAVVLQVCYLSLFSVLAVRPPGKDPSLALARLKLHRNKIGSYLSLGAESRASLASSAPREAWNQRHLTRNAILGSGPVADITEDRPEIGLFSG